MSDSNFSKPAFDELAVIGRRLCEPPTGVGRYLECLLREWVKDPGPFKRILVFAPGEPRLPAELFRSPIELRVVPPRVSPLYWENVRLPQVIPSRALLFAPYTLPWTLAARGVVSNLGIYDSRPQDFSWAARLRTTPFFRHSARRARAVIANSTSTKNDVVRYLGADPAKTEVVPLGADERLSPAADPESHALPTDVRERYGLPDGPFFLFVGKMSKRRNVPLLVSAFAMARHGGAPQHLLLVGPDYLRSDPLRLARDAGVGDAVHHAPHAPMTDLVHLYRAATAFVLPTEHEGFSLTIPEAMACGTPAVVFDHAALEGGLREAVLPAVPPTAEALSRSLVSVAQDISLRSRLRAAGLACARAFRWQETARRTLRVLVRAAGLD